MAALLTFATTAAAQDFDPRRHGPHPQPQHPRGGPNPQQPPQHPVDHGPTPEQLIQRYTGLIFQPPVGASFPISRLAQLYRERDGNMQKLIADFEQRANTAGAQQYAATVALAAFYKIDGRGEHAAKTYERAVPLNATDPTALVALGALLQDRADYAEARKNFEKALTLQTSQTDKEQRCGRSCSSRSSSRTGTRRRSSTSSS